MSLDHRITFRLQQIDMEYIRRKCNGDTRKMSAWLRNLLKENREADKRKAERAQEAR